MTEPIAGKVTFLEAVCADCGVLIDTETDRRPGILNLVVVNHKNVHPWHEISFRAHPGRQDTL